MTGSKNRTIRMHKRLGATVLGAVTLFIVLSAAGLVFPQAHPPQRLVVPFDVGARPADGADAVIAAAADALLDAPTTIAVVTGHTGARGDAAANMALSLDRAGAVRDALVAAGVPEDRIRTRGAGGTVDLEPRNGESAAARAQRTRRADLRVIENSLLAGGATP